MISLTKICPECGCIYTDGRAQCIDCGIFTRRASEEELLAFEEKIKNDSDSLYEKLDRDDRFYRSEPRRGDTAKCAAAELLLRLLLP